MKHPFHSSLVKTEQISTLTWSKNHNIPYHLKHIAQFRNSRLSFISFGEDETKISLVLDSKRHVGRKPLVSFLQNMKSVAFIKYSGILTASVSQYAL